MSNFVIMKKILLIISLCLFASCSNDEEQLQEEKCFKVKTSGWYVTTGYFVTNSKGEQINTNKFYQIGEEFCK